MHNYTNIVLSAILNNSNPVPTKNEKVSKYLGKTGIKPTDKLITSTLGHSTFK